MVWLIIFILQVIYKLTLLEYLLFAGYLILFAWLVTRVRFFNRSGLNNSQLIIIFLLKVMAGIFYGWIGLYYGNLAQMSDTWMYHFMGRDEYKLLQQQPHEYLINLFHNTYEAGYTRFFAGSNSYWNDLKSNAFIKLLSVFNIFSFGNYYVNVIFFSFISMVGPMAVYRVMIDVFPEKKIPVLVAVFLVPSFLYWSSGLHKDGIIFTAIGLTIYHTYFMLKENHFSIKRMLFILLGLLIILVLRNFLFIIFTPALFTWVIADRFPKKSLAIFCGIYFLFAILFFTGKYINPHFDFPRAVVDKQTEFLQTPGASSVPINKIEPTAASFLKNLPQTLSLTILRPYPSDVKHLLSLAAATEVFIILTLLVVFFIWHTNGIHSKSFIYFCLFFSFTLLLGVGYTVNNLGAIVRYRSIAFPLLLTPIFARIDWKRLYNTYFEKIINKNNLK